MSAVETGLGVVVLACVATAWVVILTRPLRRRLSRVRAHRAQQFEDAWAGLDLYEVTNDPAALDRAFEVVRAEKTRRRVHPGALMLEARALTLSFDRTRDVEALHKAVEQAEAALLRFSSAGPSVGTARCLALQVAATAHLRLATWSAAHSDEATARRHFAAAAEHAEQALADLDPSSPQAVQLIELLGTVHLERFDAFRERTDIDAAILCQEQVVNAPPVRANKILASGCQVDLGNALRVRYEMFGAAEDLDRALIELDAGVHAYTGLIADARKGEAEDALAINQHPQVLTALEEKADTARAMHAMALVHRYERDGTARDLEDAAELASNGTAPGVLAARAKALFSLANLRDDAQLLDQAVTAAEQAAGPESLGAERVTALMRVAQARITRFNRAGNPADLDRAEEASAELQQLAIGRRSDVLRMISVIDQVRGLTGRPDAVEAAVRHAEAALAVDQQHAMHAAVSALRLAQCLRGRYVLTGEPGDLDRAVGLLQDARPRVPRIEQAPLLGALADAYALSYHRTGNQDDLDAAAEAAAAAVDVASSGTADLIGARTILLQVVGERLDAGLSTDRRAEIERQIRALRDILSKAPPTWPFRPSGLRLLALACADRWREAGTTADLNEACTLLERAVDASPPTSVERIEILRSLAAIRREAFTKGQGPEHLEQALQASNEALAILDERLVELPVSYHVGQQRSFARVYETAVSSYVEWATIRPGSGHASIARAMLICEQSKSRVLSQQLAAQGLPAPPDVDPSLLATERSLVTEMAALDAGELAELGRVRDRPGELAARRRRELADAIKRTWSVLAETGAGADYVAFRGGAMLQWGDVQTVARGLGERTALVSLFLAEDRTYGFIVRAPWDTPALVSGDELTAMAWQDIGRRLWRELHMPDPSGRLRMTWHQALKPFLDAVQAHLAGIDRVIVAPHGLAHVIPWTAAAQASGWNSATVISTVPSFATLARVHDRGIDLAEDVLVVGDPRQDLHGAKDEARAVAKVYGVTALIGDQAAKKQVKLHLQHAPLAHFASHAFFATESPLDSGVILADGVLSAREVATIGSVPPLVILSACESGLANRIGGDEIAGLAQAFLFAGARSLIVSLWNVDDPATSALMRYLHAQLDEGADLATALGSSTDQVRATERWSHPHYWGAFVIEGDPFWRRPQRSLLPPTAKLP